MAENPYKKKLATASLGQAKAMDAAYTTALKAGVKQYNFGGLDYAVQPGKKRVYAADIVNARTAPATPAAPSPKTPTKTTAPVSPVVVSKPNAPKDTAQYRYQGALDSMNVARPVSPVVKRDTAQFRTPAKPAVPADTTKYRYAGAMDSLTKDSTRVPSPVVKRDTAQFVHPNIPIPTKPTAAKRTPPRVVQDTTRTNPYNSEHADVMASLAPKPKPSTPLYNHGAATMNTGAQAANTVADVTALGVNAFKRIYEKQFGDDRKAVSVMPSVAAATMPAPTSKGAAAVVQQAKPMRPPVITGDTINDDGNYYHLPENIDLTQIRAGVRNRGDRTPVESDGVIATSFDDNRSFTKKDKQFNPDAIFMGVDGEGRMKVGKGSTFSDDAQLMQFPVHENVEGFSKNGDGSYMMTKGDVGDKGFHGVNVYNDKGMIPMNFMIRRSDQGGIDTYGKVTGGRMVVTSPDMKHQVLLSGSVKNIEQQLNDFKKANGISKVNIVRLDNGSYSRGFRDKDRHFDEKDWREFDMRNTGGGSGFYLKGDGIPKKKFAMGGFTPGQMAGGMQVGSQLINMADMYTDGQPSTGGQVASGALSGASSGMAFGPWGAAAGAVIGGGAALLNAEEAKRKERQMQQQHQAQQLELDSMNSRQTLRNYATKGISSAGSYAMGGEVTPKFEVEGDEVVQGDIALEGAQPIASDMQTAVGASHEGGGVQGQGSGRVFSDRLKASNGKTFAVNADKLGKQKGKFEDKASSNDGAAKFTGKRMAERIDADIDNLFNEQEMKKLATQPSSLSSSFAYGGNTGDGPYTNKANKRGQYGGSSEWASASEVYEAGQAGNPYAYRVRKSADGSFFADPGQAPIISPMALSTPTSTAGSIVGVKPYANPYKIENPAAFKKPVVQEGFIDKVGNVFNGRPHINRSRVVGLEGRNRLQKKFWNGGVTDPTRPVDKTLVPTLVNNGGIGNTSVNYNGQLFGGLGTQVDQRKNYTPGTVNGTWGKYMAGEIQPRMEAGYAWPVVRDGNGPALAVRNMAPVTPAAPRGLMSGVNQGAPNWKVTGTDKTIPQSTVGTGTGARKGMDLAMGAMPFLDNFGNALATAATPQIPKPYVDPEVQLNTKFDVNPQLQEARDARIAIGKSIDQNTGQSGVSNANKQKLYASSMGNSNQLYAQKFNIENQLQNQETMINSRIGMGNRERFGEYDQQVAARRAGMMSDYANNLGNVQSDLYTAARDNKQDQRDIEVTKMVLAANPNSPQYLQGLEIVKSRYANDPAGLKSEIDRIRTAHPNSPVLKDYEALYAQIGK